MSKIIVIIALLVATLVTPFLLRPDGEKAVSIRKAERLVVITPHNESIRAEFERAFTRHMKQKFDRDVFVDWRQPGGTSEIAMFLKSEFSNAFENYWKAETGKPFTPDVRAAFTNSKLDVTVTNEGSIDDSALLSRKMFMESEVGAGIDLFFGGGAYDFQKQASSGALVAKDGSGKYGPGVLAEQKPEWFRDTVMPAMVSGEPFRDEGFRWVGTVLSAFGICYNVDVLERLEIQEKPDQWINLTDPRLFGQVALADPTKSGSVTKAFEMLIQQQIRQVLDSGVPEEEAVQQGWERAMQMILKIGANARYFSDSATKIPHDVAQGDAAAGMSIDFYGRTFNELHKKADGSSRIEFVMPEGGTSIGADPVALLRGAPNPELAHQFIEFVLSIDGQKIWDFKPGTPGGPQRAAIRRPPIRKDFYTAAHAEFMADAEVNPYEISKGFVYEEKWTGNAFRSLRFIIRTACVDTHEELREAWHALIEARMPAEALAEFEDVSMISYDEATGRIVTILNAKNKIGEVELARELAGVFRAKYARVIELTK
ncbi:ABC transporter substrate-binding protein [Verrucomicrobiales bacterium]|nr:ABC transporter substrate-binding protein [Verrucomicrobiales bacterium]MDC0311691.1 ABC transporter substrate-binding protein [bacterium]